MNGILLICFIFCTTAFVYAYQAHLMSRNPDKPETFKDWLSLLLYKLGDIVSRIPGALCVTPGYKAYQKVMCWSVDLDKRGKIWKTPDKQLKP